MKDGILKSLGILFLGVIILCILGRMGHMIMGFIILVLALIGAIVLFKKLTGLEDGFRPQMNRRNRAAGAGMGHAAPKAIEKKEQIPGPGQVACPHCGSVNGMNEELCRICGWPLPAKVQQVAQR